MADENVRDISSLLEKPGIRGAQESAVGALTGAGRQVIPGLKESVPFVGERLAAGEPEPRGLGERMTRRAARIAPYAAPAIAINPLLGTLGYGGAVLAGTAAEELGAGPGWQALAEMTGGGVVPAARGVAGRVVGYRDPVLKASSDKAKMAGYDVDPGSWTAQGMKYGVGGTPEATLKNLEKFTNEATRRTGFQTNNINAQWINETQKSLGKVADKLFVGKFKTTPQFSNELYQLSQKAEGAFGQQGNVVKTILEQNLGGARPGGAFLSPTFEAKDLHQAIKDINSRLGSGQNPIQNDLLYQTKEALDRLAKSNMSSQAKNAYDAWKSEYSAYATIRDVYERYGKEGVLTNGNINPKTLMDVIATRSGSATNASTNPLYKELGEFGETIFQTPKFPTTGMATGAFREVSESLPAKVGMRALTQPVPSAAEKLAQRTLTYGSPAAFATQLGKPVQPDITQFLPSRGGKSAPEER